MDIPQGFQLDPQSGLYYKEEYGGDAGAPVRIVTWLDPQSGTTQEVRYPAEPPQAQPLDEAEQLLEPPPEPLLVPTGLPEQNPYAAQQAAYPPEPPPLSHGVYDGSEIPPPLPQKKSKAVVLAVAASVVVLAAIGVCGWGFGWFSGQSAPVDSAVSSAPPAVSAQDVPSEAPSVAASDAVSEPEASEEPQASQLGSIEKPELVADVGIEVVYHSKTTADITLTNLHIQSGYPTKIPGAIFTRKREILYDWDVSVADYCLSLMYLCEEDGEDKTITMSDMYALLFDLKEGGSDDIFDVECSVTENSITFHNVTFPEDRGVDFSSPETVYAVGIQEGLYSYLKETRATVMPGEAAGDAADFPYAGNYICMSDSIPKEYRPSIHLGSDMRFTMIINTGEGMNEAAGNFVWDIQTGMLYLNFEQIGGGDPGDKYREAEVKILSDTQIQFLTEGFGLMGAKDQFGIFTRQ